MESRKIAIVSIAVIAIIGVFGGVFAIQNSSKSSAKRPRIVATTFAITQIANRLKLPLVGVPTTENKIPSRYAKVTKIGSPMSPSAEKIASLKPTAVYSVDVLKDQFGKSFKQQHIKPYFLNLSSVSKLQQTITLMGNRYDRKSEANDANKSIDAAIAKAKQKADQRKVQPRVLVLMGLPGAGYMIATNKSYVGNLVQIAGGKNVFESKTQEYIQPSDEMIAKKRPQVILRLEHAMPAMVTKQFQTEFKQNPIWKATPAVKARRVHDLQEPNFDATANMNVAKALQLVSSWLQVDGD
ncbi:heme ABC transporter substrate-binding protein IsdE [Lentilactobacillus sp. Marseille-Q4993]|uniref:heme ABC transporter substrate-binding protein IsdE n=1 Tax=Lentilactobacillus sp. Marseille-Q4993 TaxID=3039492 RepID=UPI0024BC2150|nr:heme ABC transporter substrate-binding protein IsdE [Lentilactobacillus sp. Marseille-Q4993]